MKAHSKCDTHSNHQLIVIVITLIQMRFSVMMIFIEAIMANTLLDTYAHIKTGTNAAQSCLSGSCQLRMKFMFCSKRRRMISWYFKLDFILFQIY